MTHELSSSPRLSRSFSFSLLFVMLLLPPRLAAAQEMRLGNEFQVNTYTATFSYQKRPSLAAADDGDFVVVWASSPQDGFGDGVFAQLFSSAGAPLASEFQVNVYTNSFQYSPVVAVGGDGDFVVAWEGLTDGHYYGIFARLVSSTGSALASEFQVNVYTMSHQRFPSVAAAPGGDFVVAWHSYTQDGSDYGVFARRFSGAGAALASEFQVNTYTLGLQRNPSVGAAPDGGFVVAWQDTTSDGSGDGITARLFSSAGAPLASEFQANVYATSDQVNPSVAFAADGELVVAWQGYGQDGSYDGIFARRFSNTGAALTSEFQVNTYITGLQRFPSVAVDGDGELVFAWQSLTQDQSDDGVFARRFTRGGAPLASEFQVNSSTMGFQGYAAVTASAGRNFVVAWQSSTQGGEGSSVFAQRFAKPIVLDIDGNGDVAPLTDGLLVLRYLFGFTGTTLVNGAVGSGCTRCNAAAIEPYLETLI